MTYESNVKWKTAGGDMPKMSERLRKVSERLRRMSEHVGIYIGKIMNKLEIIWRVTVILDKRSKLGTEGSSCDQLTT